MRRRVATTTRRSLVCRFTPSQIQHLNVGFVVVALLVLVKRLFAVIWEVTEHVLHKPSLENVGFTRDDTRAKQQVNADRKSVVQGKSVSGQVDLGGSRIHK